MPFADTWEEEKKKYGATNTKDTKTILMELTKRQIFPGLFSHARLYRMVKEYANYKTFSDKMRKHIVQKSQGNVQRVKAQLLKKLNDPSLKNAMSKYLPKNNMGIKSQYQKIKENIFKKRAEEYLKNVGNVEQKNGGQIKNLAKKHEEVLKMIDMYWPNMTVREQRVGLKSGIEYFKRRLPLLR